MSDIFAKSKLTPSQARTVADRRLDDAECLRKTGDNARANGVFYLGGLVVECLLKSILLERHPEVVSPLAAEHLAESGREIRTLIFRSHALDQMLDRLPDLTRQMKAEDERGGTRRLNKLRGICGTWSIFARYSPRTETMAHAADFLDDVREVKRWLNNA
jgi:hypothetical protein